MPAHSQPPAPPITGSVVVLGLEGAGKSTLTALGLGACFQGRSARWEVVLGDGTPFDPTLSRVLAALGELERGEPLAATNRVERLAVTVHPRAGGPPALVRWTDPNGVFVKRLLRGGEFDGDVLDELAAAIDAASVAVVVLDPTAADFLGQLEVLLRALDRLAPRFAPPSDEPRSLAVALTRWASAGGGDPAAWLEARVPGVTLRLRRLPFRTALFGIESFPPGPEPRVVEVARAGDVDPSGEDSGGDDDPLECSLDEGDDLGDIDLLLAFAEPGEEEETLARGRTSRCLPDRRDPVARDPGEEARDPGDEARGPDEEDEDDRAGRAGLPPAPRVRSVLAAGDPDALRALVSFMEFVLEGVYLADLQARSLRRGRLARRAVALLASAAALALLLAVSVAARDRARLGAARAEAARHGDDLASQRAAWTSYRDGLLVPADWPLLGRLLEPGRGPAERTIDALRREPERRALWDLVTLAGAARDEDQGDVVLLAARFGADFPGSPSSLRVRELQREAAARLLDLPRDRVVPERTDAAAVARALEAAAPAWSDRELAAHARLLVLTLRDLGASRALLRRAATAGPAERPRLVADLREHAREHAGQPCPYGVTEVLREQRAAAAR